MATAAWKRGVIQNIDAKALSVDKVHANFISQTETL